MGTGAGGTHIPTDLRLVSTGVYFHPGGHFVADTKAHMRAIPATCRFDGMEVLVTADNSRWRFSAASALADTTYNLVNTPSVGNGRWLRAGGPISIKLAIDYTLADAAALLTMPASGFRLLLEQAFWEVTADWTGGTNSAIGLSGSIAPHSTKGDLLGGSAGNVLADLTAAIGVTQGTIGVSFSAAPKMVVLEPTAVVRFDRITSVFTAGTGYAHLIGRLIE